MDFAKFYRACKRTQALGKSVKAVEACLKRESAAYIKVEEAAVFAFCQIQGYRVTTLDGTAFFPRNLSALPKNSGHHLDARGVFFC